MERLCNLLEMAALGFKPEAWDSRAQFLTIIPHSCVPCPRGTGFNKFLSRTLGGSVLFANDKSAGGSFHFMGRFLTGLCKAHPQVPF